MSDESIDFGRSRDVFEANRPSIAVSAVSVSLVAIVIAEFIYISTEQASVLARSALGAYFWICLLGTLVPAMAFFLLRHRAPTLQSLRTPPPFVSIVIPAYNEEERIAQSIEAAIRQDYPAFEVIIVDDGSGDFTRFIAANYRVKLILQPKNGGKFAALNAGIAAARGEIIVTSDSDSMLEQNALHHLVVHFADPDVGAVAGTIRPLSSNRLVRRLQCVEYVWGQEILKLAQVGSGASITVCPGPVTAFRRDAISEIGGLKGRTITEDFDATLEVIGKDWRVVYEPRALALTDAPSTWKSLFRQRLRWNRGSLQTFWFNRRLFFARRTGVTGLFWLPWFAATAYVLLIVDVLLVVLVVPLLLKASSLDLMLLGLGYMAVIELVVILQYALALLVAGERRLSLYSALPFMKALNLLLALSRLKAIYVETRGVAATWT